MMRYKDVLNKTVIKGTIIKMSGYVLLTAMGMDLINYIIIYLGLFSNIINIESTERIIGIYGSIAEANFKNYEQIILLIRKSWIMDYNLIEKINVMVILLIILYIVCHIGDDIHDVKYMNKRIDRLRERIKDLSENIAKYNNDYSKIFPLTITYYVEKIEEKYFAIKLFDQGEINWTLGRCKERSLPTQEWQIIILYIIILIILNISWLEILISILENTEIYNLVKSMISLVILIVYIVLKEKEREEILNNKIEEENLEIKKEILIFYILFGFKINIVEEKGVIYIVKEE